MGACPEKGDEGKRMRNITMLEEIFSLVCKSI